jgi:hypothetical protein
LYYLYKKIRPGSQITNKSVTIDDNDYVIITRQEYNKLLKNQPDINEVTDINVTEFKNTNQQ